MKTMGIYTAATIAGALLGLGCASQALGDSYSSDNTTCNATHAQRNKIFKGSVTAVNTGDKTISVRGFLFPRHFDMASDCRVSLQDKAVASLADLRPGQQVDIRYEDDNGVLIAKGIAQHDLGMTGHIAAIDPATGTLLVRHGLMTREFTLAPNCALVIKDNKMPRLNNLQIGDAVYVVYEPANGAKVARRIVENSSTFMGTIAAIDPASRIVKVTDGHGEKMFSLADNCPIVINDKLGASLSSLQVGERVELKYDNADGVLVANRVSPLPAAAPAAPAPAQTAANTQWHDYGYVAP